MNQKNLFYIVKQCVDDWNPYSLLLEVPNDEFDNESYSVSIKITENNSTEEIAKIISLVFTSSFGEFFEIKDCLSVAKQIKMNIEKQKAH